ncbi:electron transfer flavoprotein subunit alpha/FixB family protein [Acetobacter sp.]|uniref:electron transfer flavoprotein subunit alpha/FixB family protein n=1 Tax=Acetobacter sp. TaxID=440 RepID=UPI0039ECE0C7
MTVLLLSDHNHQKISDETVKTVSAALEIGSELHVLVAGQGLDHVVRDASTLAGVSKVIVADDERYAHGFAEPLSDLLVSIMSDYDTLIAPSSSMGKNVLPRVAALLDIAQISDIIAVIDSNTFKRPIYAGNAIQVVQSTDPKRVITVRASSFPERERGGSAVVETVSLPPLRPYPSTFISERREQSERPELTAARIVVSGGRALASAENFTKLIFPLADKIGAAVGASRAAVDSGYAPNDWQVGQTGKIVAPDLYIAAGISGAIQHLAGMKDSRIIVAINTDPDAPIFQVADYGLKADIFQALPEMSKLL